MINLNNVIENFNTVYENRNSPEKSYFLNSSLELVKDKSQKASFFDIVDALQSRRWKTEGTPSETSKAIKKLWLQAKFIYDNEPFSIRTKSKLISLFDYSITEGSFVDKNKLEIYSKQVQIYCELLYLCKIIVYAEERVTNLYEKIGIPANLQAYSDSLEEKYAKVLAFQKTPTFQFLKTLKYTDPLSYLSVFIEEKEGEIINTYPELLELFELAEYTPIHSKTRGKKDKSAKGNHSSQQLRKQMFSILKKAHKEELTNNQKELIAFTYAFFKNANMSKKEEYQQYIKANLQEYKNRFIPIKKDFDNLEKSISTYSGADKLILDYILVMKEFCELINQEMIKQENPLPVCTLNPIAKIQNTYTKSIKKFIENFKRMYTPLRDIDPTAKPGTTIVVDGDRTLNLRGTKGKFLENQSKRFGSDFVAFIDLQQDILSEHFPTLFDRPSYLSNVKTRSEVKKEVDSIDSVYSSLIKELSKIALARLSSEKEIHTLPDEYQSFFTLLGCDSNSLPSPEQLVSLNLKNMTENFFSEEDVQALDKLISNFEDFQRKIFQQKIETYCKEYMILKSEALEKPLVVEEESFVDTIVLPESATSTLEEQLPPVVEEQKIVAIKEPSPSTGGAIPKNKKAKKLFLSPTNKQEIAVSKKRGKPAQQLSSLRSLPSVRTQKKLPKFHYHNHEIGRAHV